MTEEHRKPFQSGREIYQRFIPGYRSATPRLLDEQGILADDTDHDASVAAIQALALKVEALKLQSQ